MHQKERETLQQMKDSPVPPVKGAVTDLQDIVRRPAGIFGPAHPADLDNPAVFDLLQGPF